MGCKHGLLVWFRSLITSNWTTVSSSLLQLIVELNPGSSLPPLGGDLLHVRALGNNDTLHFLFCSLGAPTLLLVHTNTSSSTVKVWANSTEMCKCLQILCRSSWCLVGRSDSVAFTDPQANQQPQASTCLMSCSFWLVTPVPNTWCSCVCLSGELDSVSRWEPQWRPEG